MTDKTIRLLKVLDVLLLLCLIAICLFKVLAWVFLTVLGIGFLMLAVAIADIQANPWTALIKILFELSPFLLAIFIYIAIRLMDKYRLEKPKFAVIFGALPILVALFSFPIWYEFLIKIVH